MDSIVSSSSLPPSELEAIKEHDKLAARDRLRNYIQQAIQESKDNSK